ncbi:MAG: 30S ribosomal protein S16 [Proteobacteria bacterium]|nr:30S ribosomal protein S16 [Pseudomonadota bacterium]MBU1450048.1 30S ribosomal protein S16 [Pseudomonadota bacterium]MBU2467244.1 30S ribosomal protein S16 [Pseudomonadota bacterium]MBU2519054.1 30S ribosomal protein S16 [Pseudomonadota bacterium]
MAVRIRLTRKGAKKKPFYRIVAADSQSPRDGKFLEVLGTYDPLQNPAQVKVDGALLQKWLDRGATPSDTVFNLLKAQGLLTQAGEGEAAAAQS